MKTLTKIFSVLLFFNFAACKNETKSNTSSISNDAKVVLFANRLKDVRLRETPDKKSNTLMMLPVGAILTGLGEESKNKDTATLRGIYYESTYKKIKTSDGKIGWVFGAVTDCIFNGKTSEQPDLQAISKFYVFLDGLDSKQLNNATVAQKEFSDKIMPLNTASNDAGFFALTNYMNRVAMDNSALLEKVEFTDADAEGIWKHTLDHNKYAQTKKIAEQGFRCATVEGYNFPEVNWTFLKNKLGSKLSPVSQSYVNQTIVENDNPAFEDGGFIIPIDEIGNRAIFWEEFNKTNPDYFQNEWAKANQRNLTNDLIMGANNTPAFDYETQKMNEEFEKAITKVIKDHPNTQTANKLSEFYELVKKEGKKRTPVIEAYIKKLDE
jgi:hypothetical protein